VPRVRPRLGMRFDQALIIRAIAGSGGLGDTPPPMASIWLSAAPRLPPRAGGGVFGSGCRSEISFVAAAGSSFASAEREPSRGAGRGSSLADDSSPPTAKSLRPLGLGHGLEPLGQAFEGSNRLRGLGGFGVRPSLGGFRACLSGACPSARLSARASRMAISRVGRQNRRWLQRRGLNPRPSPIGRCFG
jgi:hypothetical protein